MSKLVNNVRVHDLAESLIAAGYSMQATTLSGDAWEEEVSKTNDDIASGNYENKHIKRAIRLINAQGNGHDQFTSGMLVSFDLTFPNKAWVELTRYRYLTYISSMSTIHRITKLDLSSCVNQYVDERVIDVLNELIDKYNSVDTEQNKAELYLQILNTAPAGLMLTARLTTNYRCLRNVYFQRKNHVLPEWREFCEWIETLPLADILLINEKGDAHNGTK